MKKIVSQSAAIVTAWLLEILRRECPYKYEAKQVCRESCYTKSNQRRIFLFPFNCKLIAAFLYVCVLCRVKNEVQVVSPCISVVIVRWIVHFMWCLCVIVNDLKVTSSNSWFHWRYVNYSNWCLYNCTCSKSDHMYIDTFEVCACEIDINVHLRITSVCVLSF